MQLPLMAESMEDMSHKTHPSFSFSADIFAVTQQGQDNISNPKSSALHTYLVKNPRLEINLIYPNQDLKTSPMVSLDT